MTPEAGAVGPLPTVAIFLIADLRGYTQPTHERGDEAAQLAGHFAALVHEAVNSADGRVIEVRGAEVLAVFASARRALRAAVDLQARCATHSTADLPLRAGVGLDAGEPGPASDGNRGEALNVAARLCALAGPGEILASDGVVHLARRIDGLVYEERGSLALKGLSVPIRACAVRAAGSPDPQSAEVVVLDLPMPPTALTGAPVPGGLLVGREEEGTRVQAALERTLAGQGRLLLLSGEPGVGKTRLAQEALRQARERGFRTLVGRCYEQHASLPFFPIAEALAGGLASTPVALRAEVARRFPELGYLLPDLIAGVPSLSGEDARFRILRAAGGFFQELAGDAPLVLLLDDLQWADSASLELLLHLCRYLRSDRVLLLGTYCDAEITRQHLLEATLADLARERLVEEIRLHGLPREGIAALFRARFEVDEVADDLVDLLHSRTEGNAFFIEEVLAALIEQGIIYREGTRWERGVVGDLDVPRSIRSVVGQRVGRLSPEAQDLLRVASVLGQEWSLDLLLEAADQPEATVLDYLDAALAARLLEERRLVRLDRYGFAHSLIQQALYDEVPAHRLRRLHLRAGEALERMHGGKADAWAELARHFLAAGQEERATRYAIQAGNHAASLFAHSEAIRHYETALALLEDAGDLSGVAALQRKVAAELTHLNRIPEALATATAALVTYERLGDAAGQAMAHREIAWIHQLQSDLPAASPHLDAALALWPAEQEDANLARLLIDVARARTYALDYAEAAPLIERGLALAERLGESGLQAQALIEQGIAQVHQGTVAQQAATLFDRAEPLARRADNPLTLGRIHRWRGVARWTAGDLLGSCVEAQRAIEVTERAVLPGAVAFHYAMLAHFCLELGAWEDGRAASRKALALQPASVAAAELRWMEGAYAEALDLLREHLALARRRDDLLLIVEYLTALADRSLQIGQVQEAHTPAREAAALARTHGFWRTTGAFSTLAEVTVRANAADIAEILREATTIVHLYLVEVARPQLLRAQGLFLQQQGELERALATLQASAETARLQGALPQLGRTLAVLAEAARSADNAGLAQEADGERAALIARIGVEACGLAWAGEP